MKEIPLTKGQIALVDDDDFDMALQWKWWALASRRKYRTSFYAVRTIGQGADRGLQIYLHKYVIGIGRGVQVDHKNGNTLDCQKHNLRIATQSQNSANRQEPIGNRLGYRGVAQSGNKFAAKVWHGKFISLGTFDTLFEAALARDLKALEIWGEFAVLNIPNATDYEPPIPSKAYKSR